MIHLDLLQYRDHLRTRPDRHNRIAIFDIIRKRWVIAQPEEWTRQLLVQFLVHVKGYSPVRMSIEKRIRYNKIDKRFDILVYDEQMNPFILVECKSPKIKLSKKTFDQIAQYNFVLNVPILIVTNGLGTYCCQINYLEKSYIFLEDIPHA